MFPDPCISHNTFQCILISLANYPVAQTSIFIPVYLLINKHFSLSLSSRYHLANIPVVWESWKQVKVSFLFQKKKKKTCWKIELISRKISCIQPGCEHRGKDIIIRGGTQQEICTSQGNDTIVSHINLELAWTIHQRQHPRWHAKFRSAPRWEMPGLGWNNGRGSFVITLVV